MRPRCLHETASLLHSVIVQALSPSTEAYDCGKKFAYYQQLMSLPDYILVSTPQQAIEVYSRASDAWHYRLYLAGESAYIQSLDLSLSLADVHARVPIKDI